VFLTSRARGSTQGWSHGALSNAAAQVAAAAATADGQTTADDMR